MPPFVNYKLMLFFATILPLAIPVVDVFRKQLMYLEVTLRREREKWRSGGVPPKSSIYGLSVIFVSTDAHNVVHREKPFFPNKTHIFVSSSIMNILLFVSFDISNLNKNRLL